ncbi:putative DNA binding domain-containing protein [Micromonospora sp. D93]|uniref:RNA-binding domain-containing protein n=1 Tax=Micromonospora sp. D93 TaxID=2824886 RepID=UPI001B38D4EB|nr:RNA-binding domain-containing protein [Micromonospora sp. D93]MBQ1021515.1 putative DNA binding domain-containing protein [Micromonospora sp. D93]
MSLAEQQDLEAILAGTAARKRESSILDFKVAKSNLKDAWADLAEASVCFANASGGTIVVGVSDTPGGPEAFIGCELDEHTLRQRIYHLTMPGLLVEVDVVRFAHKRLLVIRVPEGLEVYSTTRGYTYHRVNDECLPMRPAEVSRLAEERRGVDWSAAPSSRSLEDVDPLALRQCRRLLANSVDSRRQSYARLSDHDLLRALKAVGDDERLTRAGELLLCTAAASAPADAVVYQHRKTQAGEPDAIMRLGTPLVLAFDELLQAIRARQGITPVTLADGQQLQIEDYPMAAVREAVANALIHGDWRARLPVSVEHSSQYLKVTSPGPLVSGITVSNILTKGSRARHPALASAFRLLGLAEEVGQGVDRMYREMIRSGRDTPLISDDNDQVSVLFRGQAPNTRITKFLATLPPEEQDDTDALLIVLVLCSKRTITAKQLAPIIQRSELEGQAVLRRLSSDPSMLLEPTRGTANRTQPTYRLAAESLTRLGNAVAYHGRKSDEVDRKVIEHMRDYDEINNRTVQRLFDVDVYAARDILKDLVDRQIITRTSEQTRGVAVRYGPGSLFPATGKKGSFTKNKRIANLGDKLF